jgi:hypothetical protein
MARTLPFDTTTAQASTIPSAGSHTRTRRTIAGRRGPGVRRRPATMA